MEDKTAAPAAAPPDDSEHSEKAACPLTAVRVFREIVRENSFTKAARRLHVTQGAVSQRVKQLESHLGCLLFVRRSRQWSLTPEGRALYEKTDRALTDIERALDSIVSGGSRRRVALGALASFTSKWLIPRLHRFYRQHPAIELITRSVNHTMDVERENAELAVVNLPSPPTSPALSAELLWRDRLFAVCSPAYFANPPAPLSTPSDLSRHTLLHDQTEIAASRHLDWQSWLQAAAPESGVDAGRGRFFTQSDLTLQAAIEGHGIALGRSSLITEDLRKGLLRTLFGATVASSGCYMCSLKTTWELPKIKIMREWLLAEAAADRDFFDRYRAV